MKKILLVLLVIGILFGAYFLYRESKNKKPAEVMATPTPNGSGPTIPASPSTSKTSLKDGTYSSDTVQTDLGYGPIQIKIIVSSGKVTDVVFLQFPNTPGHTTEVSDMALPILKQEAIASQNSPVDNITGATQTTDAFNTAFAQVLAMAK